MSIVRCSFSYNTANRQARLCIFVFVGQFNCTFDNLVDSASDVLHSAVLYSLIRLRARLKSMADVLSGLLQLDVLVFQNKVLEDILYRLVVKYSVETVSLYFLFVLMEHSDDFYCRHV